MYGRYAYASAPWAGRVVPALPTGAVLPPPVPGGTTVYVYVSQVPVTPYALGGWAGAVAPGTVPPGGVVVVPNPAAGVMTVSVWWPDTPGLLLLRQTPDGVLTPVRGAYPLAVGALTRRNYSPNPSFESGLNGVVPGAGTPTLSSVARGSGVALRATIAAAGPDEVTLPTSLPATGPATVAFDMQTSARPSSVTVTVGWTTAGGTALTASVVTLTADQVNASVAQWGRQVVTVTPPAGAATSTLKVTAAGLPAGATLDLDQITLEQGVTSGTYVDGASLGGAWTGTANLSTSVVAPIVNTLDGECPFDVPVTYIVYAPTLTGGRVTSAPAVLVSDDRSWLTHPASPAAPVAVTPTVTPALTRALDQAVFRVLGRKNPVVVSAANRIGPSGTISLATNTFIERDALLALFADGSPVLLRTPGAYGYGYGRWLALADLTEDPGPLAPWQQGRVLTAAFQQVDAPAAANSVIV